MKKLLYILFFLLPVVVSAQFNLYKDSPLDYAWKYVGNKDFSTGEADYTSIAFSPSGEPYVAYSDETKYYKATVMKFDGSNWVNVGNAGFSSGQSAYTSLAFSPIDLQPYLAFSSGRATVMKFNGSNWTNVGNAGFSIGEADYTSLAFSPFDSLPYIAFEDYGNSMKATVMKFDGNNWVNVGSAGFSAGEVEYTSLAFSPSGQPYVAYEDFGNSRKATVMKFDGTNWVNVGLAGFSTGVVYFASLAVNPSDGQPYVVYSNCATGHNGNATAMKFDGTSWVYVGSSAGFSEAQADYISLAFNPSDGKPYVAYADIWCYFAATVMRFDGTSWTNVGNEGFSVAEVKYTSLAFNPSGEPYVAYQLWVDSQKATVMKYDSVFVGMNETQELRLLLYPNPATDKITIETSRITEESNLVIVNIDGQPLITRQITEQTTTINISTLPSGVYFVRVTNDRTVEVGKIIKQ